MPARPSRIWMYSLAAASVVFAWQWLTVTANYGGNWTALFCTGEMERPAPELTPEHIYRFAGSTGFDGQFYHYIAHDPLMRTNLRDSVDDPRHRYRRIFVPAVAYLLALGHSAWVDWAYRAEWWLAVALGVWWSCRFLERTGLAAAWGLLFLLAPAVPVTTDRLVVDGAMASLTAAFLYFGPAPSWRLFVVLSCAALTRETGFLVIAGYCAWLFFQKRWRAVPVFALAGVPAVLWYAYISARTLPSTLPFALAPFGALVNGFVHPLPYPASMPMPGWVKAGDDLALAGAAAAFVVGLFVLWQRKSTNLLGPALWTGALFAVLGIMLRQPDLFLTAFDIGRVFSPLLMILAALAATTRRPAFLIPAAMILPRVAIQFAPQVIGIGHWLVR